MEQMTYNPVIKRTLLVFVPIFIATISIAITFVSLQNKFENQIYRNIEKHKTDFQEENIQEKLLTIVNQLSILSSSSHIETFWENTANKELLENLQEQFLDITMYMQLYDQVRLIDTSGKEIIRINFNAGNPEIVSPSKLQNKKTRYYFEKSIRLNRNEFYISHFDLNIENGKIEQPIKPMIRIATPVFDKHGIKRGIVIFNYLGQTIIDQFLNNENILYEKDLMLLNSNGYWLKGPSPEKEWGFMYKNKEDISFADLHPAAWERIKKVSISQFKTERGLYTSQTINLIPKELAPKIANSNLTHLVNFQIISEENFWKIVSFIPSEKLYANRKKRINISLVFVSISSLLFLILSWLLAKVRVSKQNTEKVLEESEARFELIANYSSNCEIFRNANGEVIYTSPSFEDLTGYKKDDYIQGKVTFKDIIHPDDIERMKKKKNEVMQGNKINELESRIITKKGLLKYVSISSQPVFLGTKFSGIRSSTSDITNRKEKEKEIKNLNTKLSKAQGIASVGYFEWFKDKGIITGSDEFFKIWETKPENHTSFNDFINSVDPDDRAEVYTALEFATKNKKLYDVDFRILLSNNSIKHIHVIGEFNYDNNGNATYLLGMVHDITKLKEAEKKIKKSETHLNTIFNASQVGILLNKDRKILFANNYMIKLMGFSLNEIYAKESSFAYLSGEEYERVDKNIISGLQEKESVVQETQFKTKEGKVIDVLVSSAFYNGKDTEEGIISVIANISKQKEVQKELIKAIEAKNKFFSIIAHDLRGPLGSLSQIIQLMHEKQEIFDDETRKSIFASIYKSSRNTCNLLDNLLKWALSERGLMKLIPKELILKDIVDNNIQLLNEKIALKNNNIKVDISPDAKIFADEDMLNTIVRNLISNANKFTPENGDISVFSELGKDKKTIRLYVKDTGVGMEQTIVKKLFNIDSNHSTLGTNEERGTGLGLKLCAEFVKKNNGSIKVESIINKGTTFILEFPNLK
jgi:PAS domain S-box-containing protein